MGIKDKEHQKLKAVGTKSLEAVTTQTQRKFPSSAQNLKSFVYPILFFLVIILSSISLFRDTFLQGEISKTE